MRYLHIGYPKSLSTTLQRDFFNRHPELTHLGIGCGTNLAYVDKTVEAFFENYIRYADTLVYRDWEQHFKDRIQSFFHLSNVGMSGEHLSFKWTADSVGTVEKAERMQAIFGRETVILMVVRNQRTLLPSLYREGIRMGYPGTYQEFIEYAYYLVGRNFTADFEYHRVYELYSDLFDTVHVFPIERYDSAEALANTLAEALGVSPVTWDLGHYNPAMEPEVLGTLRRLNALFPHDLGNCLWDGSAKYRMHGLPGHYARKDQRTKSRLKTEARKSPALKPLSYDCDPRLWNELMSRYRRSNAKMDLPEEYP